jgi:sensor histidine kinase YesM
MESKEILTFFFFYKFQYKRYLLLDILHKNNCTVHTPELRNSFMSVNTVTEQWLSFYFYFSISCKVFAHILLMARLISFPFKTGMFLLR